MIWARQASKPPPPYQSGLYAVRRGTPNTVAPGDRLAATPCLICGWAIGQAPAVTVAITHYVPGASAAGDLPTSGWLIHAEHHGVSTRALHDLAQWRLATESPTEEEVR